MRIIHIEDFFQPEAGYQVNILARLQVEQGHEVVIVTGHLDKSPDYLSSFFGRENIDEKDAWFENRTGAKIIRLPVLAMISGRAIYHPKIFRVVSNLNPDVLFVHGEDTMIGIQYIFRRLRKKFPLILDCHMVEMASENRFKNVFRWVFRNFITPIILKKSIPLVRVVDSSFVEDHYGIPISYTKLFPLGCDTGLFRVDNDKRISKRRELRISDDEFVVLYAGKLDEYKGGLLLAELIKQEFHDGIKKICFVVIGKTVGKYGEMVESKIKESSNRVLRFDTQTYYNLADYYQCADIAVFPKQCSLSYFDVQSMGIPVVFESNELNDLREKKGGAIIFKPGDVNDFKEKVEFFRNLERSEFLTYQENARAQIGKELDYYYIAKQFEELLLQEHQKYQS